MSIILTSIMSRNDKMLWEKIINENNEEKQEMGWDGGWICGRVLFINYRF